MSAWPTIQERRFVDEIAQRPRSTPVTVDDVIAALSTTDWCPQARENYFRAWCRQTRTECTRTLVTRARRAAMREQDRPLPF